VENQGEKLDSMLAFIKMLKYNEIFIKMEKFFAKIFQIYKKIAVIFNFGKYLNNKKEYSEG